MKRTLFIFLACVISLATAADRPNIVLIMADDIGYECLSCYGSESNKTPNLDALAASGMKFNHAHSQPICTPSRVQIMTGIYNNRNYVKFGYLDPAQTTFGNVLRDAGYQTAIAGKWQLEGGYEGVKNFGFDRHCLWQLTRRPSRYPNPGLEIDRVEKDFKEGQFGPDLVSNYVCDYMAEKKGDDPFFVYYPMIMPHWPFVPTPDSEDWDPTMWRNEKGEPGGYKGPEYWPDMVRYTDKMVGKVVNKVEALGIRDNTLIIFTGDNGTYESITTKIKGKDYKGGKSYMTDNGTHVAFLASWPGKIKAGTSSDALVDFSDVLPTLTGAAGVTTPEGLDGKSLMPVFTGEGERNKDHIFCWYSRDGVRDKAKQFVRDQRYKLYSDGRFFETASDLLEKNPIKKDGMSEELAARHKELKEALVAHTARTTEYDSVQNGKRDKLGANKPKKKKEKKPKKKKPAAQ